MNIRGFTADELDTSQCSLKLKSQVYIHILLNDNITHFSNNKKWQSTANVVGQLTITLEKVRNCTKITKHVLRSLVKGFSKNKIKILVAIEFRQLELQEKILSHNQRKDKND